MGLKVSVTEDDIKGAEAPDYSLLPTGWYNFEIIDAEYKEFDSKANKGRPYYPVTVRVLEGDFAGRRQWVNVPLFTAWNNDKKSKTNFVQFFQSVTDDDGDLVYATEEDKEGKPVLPSEFEVPDAGELISQRVTARVRIKPNEYQGKKEDRNEIGSFRAYNPDVDESPSKPEPGEDEPTKAKAKSGGKKGSLDL